MAEVGRQSTNWMFVDPALWSIEEIRESHVYQRWLADVEQRGATVLRIEALAVHKDQGAVWGLAIRATIRLADGTERRGQFDLVPPAVNVLTLVCVNDKYYALMTQQACLALGGQEVLSNPSGRVQPDEDLLAAAWREMGEKVGSVEGVLWGPMFRLSPLPSRGISDPLRVSPSTTNEAITLFCVVGEAGPTVLERLQQQSAGVTVEGERTRAVPVPLEDVPSRLWHSGFPDVTTMLSWNSFMLMAEGGRGRGRVTSS